MRTILFEPISRIGQDSRTVLIHKFIILQGMKKFIKKYFGGTYLQLFDK